MNNITDEYFLEFPEETRKKLLQVRECIKGIIKDTTEVKSYGIIAFTYRGENLIHYYGYKNHIGFYPGVLAINNFADKISKFKYAKGSVQFPISEAMPLTLIKQIVKFRMADVDEKLTKKK